MLRRIKGIRRWCITRASDVDKAVNTYEDQGKKNPPKINPILKKAGRGQLPDLPPQVELSAADEWQPPRLRTEQPLTSYKYQYRGGYKLLFDCLRFPVMVAVVIILLSKLKLVYLDAVYGPVDPMITKQWADFDDKRPSGEWPPRVKSEIGRPVGITQEYNFNNK